MWTQTIGSFHILEIAKTPGRPFVDGINFPVYGANEDMPFTEDQKCDHRFTLRQKVKRSNGSCLLSYIWNSDNYVQVLYSLWTLGTADMVVQIYKSS